MTHEESHHEFLSVSEFFEEYWALFFFGAFFLMNMFLPLLFLDNRNWLYWALVITFSVAMGLLVIPGIMGRNKKSSKDRRG